MHRILRLAKKRIVLLDGATGTNLLDKGLDPGESPSILNVRNPGAVEALQRSYAAAGADVILTNTFSANPMNMPSQQLPRVLREGVRIARKAAGRYTGVLGDIGPFGEMIQPYGTVDFEEAVSTFKMIARILSQCGIKAFFIETFTSMIEAKAAFIAAREFSSDIFICFSLQDNGRTVMGESPEALACTFDALGAQAVGVNCTLPEVAVEAVERMSRVTSLPLVIKPNAGAVHIHGTMIKHSLTDLELARFYARYIKAGANMIGGCCGTTPEFVKRLKKKNGRPRIRKVQHGCILASPSSIFIPGSKDFAIVGERMNPSGRKRVKECLLQGDYHIYADEARKQEMVGADILDVNAYIVDKQETETLSNAVKTVITASKLPVFIDTQSFEAAERVLRFYPGIGVLNSVPARTRELRTWLPMIKKYGFKVVISLIGRKIPRTVKERMEYVEHALVIARTIGFPCQDMIFDPLVFSAATDSDQVSMTLDTVRLLRQRGFKTVLGLSNVSFGLPARAYLNVAFMSAAVAHGVTFVIVNPLSKEVQIARASCQALFRGKVTDYIAGMRERDTASEEIPVPVKHHTDDDLSASVIAGNVPASVQCARSLLASRIPPQKIIDEHITGALKEIGDRYESGKAFIPDLLCAADAAQHALNVIKKHLPRGKKKGTLILATVKGDIHDIGKNVAAMIFESSGYRVIDLGKDVDAGRIIRAAKKYKPDVIGLSALLTTTMPEMGRVIRTLREQRVTTKVIVGGPNVSDAFAREIGAFGAAPTVMAGLRLLKRIM
ncbi:homocysteine S-methyltransferase family protein [candidate division WOR-3 bacterium]|nr:homocysteine S-methyltransferase family protein [candidate division WOR-3 bacterium]